MSAKSIKKSKKCPKCNLIKTRDEFYFNKRKDGYDSFSAYCRDCTADYQRNRYRENPAVPIKTRELWLKSRYGITLEQFAELEKKHPVCAICGESDNRGFRLGVDHDHRTGKIRGLLCNTCNRGIGLLKDDITTLANAIKYLERSK